MDATSNKQTKRSSMLAYVPVHRRSDLPDQVQRSNQQRYSIDGQGNKRSSYGLDLNSNGARYSADFAGRPLQQQQRGWRRGQHNNGSSGGNSMDDEDYSEDNSFSSTPAAHRYSNYHSNRSSMSSYDPRMEKLGTMLENLSYDDPRHSAGPEEWDELLRQYDRSDEEAAILARKNKRASRVMDPFNEPPGNKYVSDVSSIPSHYDLSLSLLAQVPVVDEPTVILDCYDFPKSFKTHHLHDIFREYENIRGGYRIKWMDDTRALIIFEHPATGKSFVKGSTNVNGIQHLFSLSLSLSF
jgi:hypothetical protein